MCRARHDSRGTSRLARTQRGETREAARLVLQRRPPGRLQRERSPAVAAAAGDSFTKPHASSRSSVP